MTFLAPDISTVSQEHAPRAEASSGALHRFFKRIGTAFAKARQRRAEREYLAGHYHLIAKDTGIDATALRREVNKPAWKA